MNLVPVSKNNLEENDNSAGLSNAVPLETKVKNKFESQLIKTPKSEALSNIKHKEEKLFNKNSVHNNLHNDQESNFVKQNLKENIQNSSKKDYGDSEFNNIKTSFDKPENSRIKNITSKYQEALDTKKSNKSLNEHINIQELKAIEKIQLEQNDVRDMKTFQENKTDLRNLDNHVQNQVNVNISNKQQNSGNAIINTKQQKVHPIIENTNNEPAKNTEKNIVKPQETTNIIINHQNHP